MIIREFILENLKFVDEGSLHVSDLLVMAKVKLEINSTE